MKHHYTALIGLSFLFTGPTAFAQEDMQAKINTILETLAAQEEVIQNHLEKISVLEKKNAELNVRITAAQSTANAAQITANTAVSSADTAKKQADLGVSRAAAAQNTADHTIPSGTVMAFNLPSGCPSGWAVLNDAAGRSIIGVGAGRSYRARGGNTTIGLTAAQLPSHNHSLDNTVYIFQGDAGAMMNSNNNSLVAGCPYGSGATGDCNAQSRIQPTNARRIGTNAVGQGQTIDIMSPFIVLYLCKKN